MSPLNRRVCTIEELSNGYVVRLYSRRDGTVATEDFERFIEHTLADVEQRIERYFLLQHSVE
ncbi:MAG TPA: hypothetical protein VGJ57_10750 [Nitrospirales bacterium]|jgi:hypothetical protein